MVHDRFTGTAVLDHEQALLLGTRGYVARGSGIDTDARRDHSFVDLGEAFDVVVEAWRGALVHRVELDAAGALSRVKIVDPSFLNWPALPVSLADTIVQDFPLANKSFNQSYAGNDL